MVGSCNPNCMNASHSRMYLMKVLTICLTQVNVTALATLQQLVGSLVQCLVQAEPGLSCNLATGFMTPGYELRDGVKSYAAKHYAGVLQVRDSSEDLQAGVSQSRVDVICACNFSMIVTVQMINNVQSFDMAGMSAVTPPVDWGASCCTWHTSAADYCFARCSLPLCNMPQVMHPDHQNPYLKSDVSRFIWNFLALASGVGELGAECDPVNNKCAAGQVRCYISAMTPLQSDDARWVCEAVDNGRKNTWVHCSIGAQAVAMDI